MPPPQSAIPDFYYALFAFYEPALTILGFIGALSDPETVTYFIPSCTMALVSHTHFRPTTPKRRGQPTVPLPQPCQRLPLLP